MIFALISHEVIFLQQICNIERKLSEQYILSFTSRRDLSGNAFQTLKFVHSSWRRSRENYQKRPCPWRIHVALTRDLLPRKRHVLRLPPVGVAVTASSLTASSLRSSRWADLTFRRPYYFLPCLMHGSALTEILDTPASVCGSSHLVLPPRYFCVSALHLSFFLYTSKKLSSSSHLRSFCRDDCFTRNRREERLY